MPEPLATVGLGAIAAYLGKDGLQKLLGPTAEYLGLGIRDLAQRRIENIGRIFQKAESKLGDKINMPGEIPPRVLKEVLNEGSYCDDELAAEYFGGVLASSRSEQGRDDRGARMAKIIDSLSSYQIRAHYLIYSTVKSLLANEGLPFDMKGRPKMQIFIPFSGYMTAMDFNEAEGNQVGQILNHIFFGLASDDLIDNTTWQYGPQEAMKQFYSEAHEGGIVCGPSALGAELYLWAFGQADQTLEYIFDKDFIPVVADIPQAFPNAIATKVAKKT